MTVAIVHSSGLLLSVPISAPIDGETAILGEGSGFDFKTLQFEKALLHRSCQPG
jgi:hypothetical protein